FLPLGIDALVDRDMDLIVVRRADVEGAAFAGHMQAAPAGESLLQIVGVVVGVAPPRHVTAVPVKGLAKFVPVAIYAGCAQASQHQEDDEDDSSGSDALSPVSAARSLLVLEQLDDAPEDEQDRPIMGEPVAEIVPL